MCASPLLRADVNAIAEELSYRATFTLWHSTGQEAPTTSSGRGASLRIMPREKCCKKWVGVRMCNDGLAADALNG